MITTATFHAVFFFVNWYCLTEQVVVMVGV